MEFLEQMYESYQQDPMSVDESWQLFFEGVEFGQNKAPSESAFNIKELDVYRLIRAYRDFGHLKADLDPLKLSQKPSRALELSEYNLTLDDLNTPFQSGSFVGKPGATLKEILSTLENTYCKTLSVQIADCSHKIRAWFYSELEDRKDSFSLSKDEKINIFKQICRTESLEKFIHTRFVGTKRFSIEGGDAMIPMLCHLADQGTSLQMQEMVIGMAHRGRINVLANFLGKGFEEILASFEGNAKTDLSYEGDVKYHLGYSADRETPHGPCHLSLAFNPSHLEYVGPVVQGMVRVKQRTRHDTEHRKKVVPIVIHGDAAFAGQGVVTETLQLSKLPGYTVGGTLHIILNNQIGFTTLPSDSRSTMYSSDASKVIKAPILLVNGDDVEACVQAMDIAMRFRDEFGEDIVIDLICYRRFGHNESDEPSFTQPLMYQTIKKHPTLMALYSQQLISEGVIDQDFADSFFKDKMKNLQEVLEQVRVSAPESKFDSLGGLWQGLRRGTEEDFKTSFKQTQIGLDKLTPVITALTEEPTGLNINSKVKRLISNRKKMIDNDKIDWGLAELISYGSLCVEGTPVRISGQDCKRGTFTHRHASYFDQTTGEEFTPLSKLNPTEGEFCVYNSSLSEMAVLGFEYGNSSADPNFLIIWEAQFGDFANSAQVIIDQFISSAEVKWARGSGLVMLLPHGYEGQGPEHSSARLERFLQLCAQENLQVCNLTTPANLFHAMRRQMRRDFRKPLVIMSPKSLLRHPQVHSTLAELTEGYFKEVIEDVHVTSPDSVETVILCSGKIFYEIDAAREKEGYNDRLCVVRVEQLYPFPKNQLTPFLNGFSKLKRVVWAQEEPQNMGAYFSVYHNLQALMSDLGLNKIPLEYVGRKSKASPATGSPVQHKKEQQTIIDECMSFL